MQVAAIFFLIAFDPTPLWVDLLVYGTVAITVISGVDYFFGLRRMLREAEERRRGAGPDRARPDAVAAQAACVMGTAPARAAWTRTSAATASGSNCAPALAAPSASASAERHRRAVGAGADHHVPRVGQRQQRAPSAMRRRPAPSG